MIISALTTPATGGSGLSISVKYTTKNQGLYLAEATTTSIYFSTNATYETTDTLLTSRAVPSLAAGAVSTETTTVTIPVGKLPGTYYIIVVSDANRVVTEKYRDK